MSGKRLSWQDVETLIGQAADAITASVWQPDVIIALSRGGFVPATMIAYKLGVKTLGGLPTYKDADGLRHLSPLLKLGDLTNKKVLIVDDSTISGRLFKLSAEAVRKSGGEPRTCALISLGQCPDPNYLIQKLPGMPTLPWEA